MKASWKKLETALSRLLDEENPNEPAFDPAHLAAVLIGVMAALGCLYWLLWTLLVFEGGLFAKIGPALSVLFTEKTLKDYGYLGDPYAMGVFEGWRGNLIAGGLTAATIVALHRLYRGAKRRTRP